MAFLASGISSGDYNREKVVKETIKIKLTESIKELQADVTQRTRDGPVETDEITNRLCVALESCFIHGIKDSFFGKLFTSSSSSSKAAKTSAAGSVAAAATAARPEPSFWFFALHFTHKETLSRLGALSQITSDVGRCRAWIRVAINDGLLGSYLQSMVREKAATSQHYKRFALMRDSDVLDVVIRFISGIEVFPFRLATNSGLLNRWQSPPLILAGLWAPDKVSHVVCSGVDVLSTLDEAEECSEFAVAAVAAAAASPATAARCKANDEEVRNEREVQPIYDPAAASGGHRFLSRGLLGEDEALRLILQASSPLCSTPARDCSTPATPCLGSSPQTPPPPHIKPPASILSAVVLTGNTCNKAPSPHKSSHTFLKPDTPLPEEELAVSVPIKKRSGRKKWGSQASSLSSSSSRVNSISSSPKTSAEFATSHKNLSQSDLQHAFKAKEVVDSIVASEYSFTHKSFNASSASATNNNCLEVVQSGMTDAKASDEADIAVATNSRKSARELKIRDDVKGVDVAVRANEGGENKCAVTAAAVSCEADIYEPDVYGGGGGGGGGGGEWDSSASGIGEALQLSSGGGEPERTERRREAQTAVPPGCGNVQTTPIERAPPATPPPPTTPIERAPPATPPPPPTTTTTCHDGPVAQKNEGWRENTSEWNYSEERDDGGATVDEIFVKQSTENKNVKSKNPKKREPSKSPTKVVSSTPMPCLSGFIDSWNPFGGGKFFDTPPPSDGGLDAAAFSAGPALEGFTLRQDISIGQLDVRDSQLLLAFFDKVAREEGLDAQNWECFDCSRAIGTIFGPAKVCAFTKKYYCEECHMDELSIVPARIVLNWDFREYKVSKKAKHFLTSFAIEPVININVFNKSLFEFATELDDIITLRKQVSYLDAYLTTCSKARAKDTLVKMLWPREYLYTNVELYAIRDLQQTHSGQLRVALRAAVKFGRDHVLSCELCRGKGFICEHCRDQQPVYPFDIKDIAQCQKCFTVFHLECSRRVEKCPKCDRHEARNLNWHITLSKMERTAIPS